MTSDSKLPCIGEEYGGCASSDAVTLHEDGKYHCYSCGCDVVPSQLVVWQLNSKVPFKIDKKTMEAYVGGEIENVSNVTPIKKELDKKNRPKAEGVARAIEARGLSLETCKKWDYLYGEYYNPNSKQTEPCHIAQLRDGNRKLLSQKMRFRDKNMTSWGGAGHSVFFGQHLWKKGRFLIVTEGEIDALSVYEVNKKQPVVSIPHGCQSAVKTFAEQQEWLKNFERIILMFDMDDQGKQAAEAVAKMFPRDKCRIAKLSEKDANDVLMAGKITELAEAHLHAENYKPAGIVTLKDIRKAAMEPTERGLDTPWPTLTDLTYGFRQNKMYGWGAGTGVGKTEILKEIAVKGRIKDNESFGIIFLEEDNAFTAKCLAGKVLNQRIHLPNAKYNEEDVDKAFNLLEGEDQLCLYDSKGERSWEAIKEAIRYMVAGFGCKWILLDHITAIVHSDPGENTDRLISKYAADLQSLIGELGFTVHLTTQLNTPTQPNFWEGGKKILRTFENGGEVTLNNLYGSRALAQWCDFVFAIERDMSSDETRNIVTIRVLKDRLSGNSTGKTVTAVYDSSGRLLETGEELRADVEGVFKD